MISHCTCRAAGGSGGAYVPTLFVGMHATQGRYNVRVSRLTEVLPHEPLEPKEARWEIELHPVQRGLVKRPGDWPWSRRGGEVLFLE